MTIQLLILQNLLYKCLNTTQEEYKPEGNEVRALGWFYSHSNQGEAEQLELLKQGGTLGIEPSELLALRWLADKLIGQKL